MLSRSIRAVTKGKISFFFFFFFYGRVVFQGVTTLQPFIHSSTDGHLDCFQILALVNNAAMNVGVLVFFQISVYGFFRETPEVEFLGHKAVSFLIF